MDEAKKNYHRKIYITITTRILLENNGIAAWHAINKQQNAIDENVRHARVFFRFCVPRYFFPALSSSLTIDD